MEKEPNITQNWVSSNDSAVSGFGIFNGGKLIGKVDFNTPAVLEAGDSLQVGWHIKYSDPEERRHYCDYCEELIERGIIIKGNMFCNDKCALFYAFKKTEEGKNKHE